MDDRGKAQIQAIGAGLLGFGLVVGMGSFFVIPRGASLPASFANRDAAVIFAPQAGRPPRIVAAATLPATSAAPATTAAPAALAAASGAPALSPAPVLSEDLRANAGFASPAASTVRAAAPAAAAPAAPGLIAAGSLATEASTPSAALSGGAAASGGAVASAAKTAAPASVGTTKIASARVSAPVVAAAAVVHYGSSDRSQLMERGAGPVYNFGARGAKADPIAGAMQDVLAAQQKINGLGVSDSDKAALQQNTAQFQQAAAQADAAVQQATIQAGAPAPGH